MSVAPPDQSDSECLSEPAGLPIIGAEEYVALPDWNIKHLRAKTDTGAQTSAVDAYDIEELPGNRVRFTLVASRKHPERRREIEAAPDPDAKRRELEEMLAAKQSPFPRAEALSVHDLIDPRETRPELCKWLARIQPLLLDLLGPTAFAIRP